MIAGGCDCSGGESLCFIQGGVKGRIDYKGGRELRCWSVVVSSREQSRRKWTRDESEVPPVRIRRIRIGASFVLSRYRG
ncbi:hypothetical protein F2Q69_00031540 [Brassica cretica]|uniref:Uncharacterized protein n=1 Tax=Brassica cretica TaxID=69181 RepID=A0A8S9S2Q7_BRACR|nr:hypothetical protein F2Q69_00031540 [Brassica cretica]